MKRIHSVIVSVAALLAGSQMASARAAQSSTTQPNEQSTSAQTADLRPKLTPGAQARYRWTFDNIDAVAMGTAPGPERSLRFGATLLVRVPQEKQPSHDVELIYESITASTRTATGPMEFDSATPAEKDGDNPLAGGYRPIIGRTLKIKLDEAGNIVSIVGVDDLMQVSPRLRRSRNIFLEKDSVQRTFGSIFSNGRSQPQTSIGESWSTSDKYAFSEKAVVEISNIHTLMSIEGDAATIETRTEAKPPVPGAPQAAAIRSQKATGQGKVVWNTKNGQLHSSAIEHNVTLEFETANIVVINTARVKSTIERVE